jgi:PhnB protein
MATKLNPYLNFRDTARAAMEFYHGVFGGELTLSTFGEMHASEDPAEADKVMHAALEIPGGLTLMASDLPNSMPYSEPAGFSISLSGDDEAELSRWFQQLADGGSVAMALEKAPWGDMFGMCTDRFGISWLVNVSAS